MIYRARFLAVTLILSCLTTASCGGRAAPIADTVLLGIYYGNQGQDMDGVRDLEGWQGKKSAVVNMFTNWCESPGAIEELFERQLLNIWDNGSVPMVTWEPFLCSPDQTPDDVEVRAAAGEYDVYLGAWADHLKAFLGGSDGTYGTSDDRRAYIRLGHEMNGDWYPWGAAVGNNSPSDFVDMWERVRGVFNDRGMDATRVQWIWAVNHDDVGPFGAEEYYPGDANIDWVGIDGFNWGATESWSTWKSPSASYDGMLGRVRTLTTKPVGLVEFGTTTSTSSGPSVAAKSQWITELFDYTVAKKLRMVAWFNEDKETDWAVFGGGDGDTTYTAGNRDYRAYSAYRAGVRGDRFIGSDSSRARLLTDDQFAGR